MTAALRRPQLSDAEWAAVSIALQDADRAGCGEIDPAGRGMVGRVLATLFGGERFHPLADPRLEAVRRFACATHRRRVPAEDLADDLTTHGFSRAQIDAIALLSIRS